MCRPIIRVRFPNITRCAWLATALAVLLAGAHVSARVQAPALTVKATFAEKQTISPTERIALSLNRPLQPAEGKLAVFIGVTDVTALFTAVPNGLSYAPAVVPLPAGENAMTIHLVSPIDVWKELASFTLRVAGAPATVAAKPEPVESKMPADAAQASTTPDAPAANASANRGRFGFDKFELVPAVTVGVVAQPGVTYFPLSNRPERTTYTDATLQGSIRTDMARGLFNTQTNFDVVGTSFQGQALRFGQMGQHAPRIDLSSYLMQFQFSKAKVSLGNVSFGANRFLLDGFSSRGITLAVPLTQRLDIALAAMNGSSVVGWSNFFGLDRRQHQHVSGTIGYEFLPEQRGKLRVEATLLQGSLQPISNFNEGNITDAEQSRGYGLRIQASNESQRLRVDAGFARSRFNNPADATLMQGMTIAPARAATRNAHYVEVGYDVLKERQLTKTKKANLTVNVRHERVAPLFRSVTADAQANKFQNQFEVAGSIGEFTLAASNFRFNDNLDNLPSVLRVYTRRQGAVLGMPLASLSRNPERPWWWLPAVSYNFDRTHQFALTLPSNADFNLPQLPNQISTNHSFASEWQKEGWRLGYRYNQSFQNNRAEREGLPIPNTLGNVVHSFTLGISPSSRFDLTFELNRERLQSRDTNANKDKERNDQTLRYGPGINWRITQNSALTANVFDTVGRSLGDLSMNGKQRNLGFDAQWSHGFVWEKGQYKKLKAQFYLRYANQYARALDFLFGINTLTRNQTVNMGLNFTLF
jgi:hypothetical protein